MIDFFISLHPVLQALIATCFTWGVTALGSAGVFLARDISKKTLDAMLGFAAGVMIAASFWSLLTPAIKMSEGKDIPAWVPAAADIPSAPLAGAVALAIGIGIQNFPEGLAVSLPLRREGMSRLKSFWYGQLSAIVEPIAGVIGAAAVILAH